MEEVFILNKFLDNIKGKLSPKKKGDDEEFEEEEILDDESAQDEVTNPNYDKTSATNTEIDTDEEESDEAEQTKSIVDKLKAKLLKKKSKTEDDEDQDEDKDKKKRKISPIAIIVVVGLIIFLFVPDQNSDNPEDAPAEPVLKTPAYKKNKPQVTEEPKKEEPAIDAPATETPAIEEPTIDEPVVEDPAPVPTPSTESDTSSIDDILSEDPVVPPTDDVTTPEPMPEPESTPAPIEDIDLSGMNTDTGEDSIDGGISSDIDQGDMTDQILKDLESQVNKEQPKANVNTYVAPPDYEYRGRGLVYNCNGKHWACVDGPSYKQCEDNNTFQTQKSAKIECYPFNVYENGRGCEQMQNRLVSSGAKTDFCKN